MGKGEGEETSPIRTGIHKEYLEGLDNLRKLITGIESDIDKLKREFYSTESIDEDAFESYLKNCNEKLLYCNTMLRKNGKELFVIDSELKLVKLLNEIRQLDDDKLDPEVITFLTEFWENLKIALDSLKGIALQFQLKVLKRLKSSCVSYQNGEKGLDLTREYSEHVKQNLASIQEKLKGQDTLNKSFVNGIKQDLLTNTSFSDRILLSCDQKAFPILRLVPDLTEKLVSVCSVSRNWVDRDETYVHDISNYIREKRKETRLKEAHLRRKKEEHEQKIKSTDDAQELFETNKQKLAKIEEELETIEQQITKFSQTKKYKFEEKKQKEGMVGFLEISITQTKKNYTLQLKKSRLLRHLRELEESLGEIEKELKIVQKKEIETRSAKAEIKVKVDESNESYKSLKTELESFTKNVNLLEEQVTKLTDSLTQVEIIHSCKTCPEKVEDFYERPSTVKLAPSLKEKILMRKRKFLDKKF